MAPQTDDGIERQREALERLRARLAAGDMRIEYGNAERTRGADDKARAIDEEVARRGPGGAAQLAKELGVSEKTISKAIARARRAPSPARALPGDTLERLLEAELESLPLLFPLQWGALRVVVRGTAIDATWIEEPGELLAQEIEDAELPETYQPTSLAATCRTLPRVQALAIIDACQRDDPDGSEATRAAQPPSYPQPAGDDQRVALGDWMARQCAFSDNGQQQVLPSPTGED